MIDFEEELKRFSPSLEVSAADEDLYKNDLKDITDIVLQMTADLRDEQILVEAEEAHGRKDMYLLRWSG